MAVKPKTPLAAWVVRNRKARAWKDIDLAERVGVSRDTVRGWEANRAIGATNRSALEDLFGETAPGEAQPADMAALVRAITDLVEEMRLAREREQDAAAAMLRVAEVFLSVQRPRAAGEPTEPAVPVGSAR